MFDTQLKAWEFRKVGMRQVPTYMRNEVEKKQVPTANNSENA